MQYAKVGQHPTGKRGGGGGGGGGGQAVPRKKCPAWGDNNA